MNSHAKAIASLSLRAKVMLLVRELFAPDIPDHASAQMKWERRVEGPMFVASLAFLLLYAWNALGDNEAFLNQAAAVGMWAIWGAFLIDYLVRLYLAENRAAWMVGHWWETAMIMLPMFRPLRALRVLPTLVLLQRYSAANARVTVALYTSVASLLIIIVAAISLYEAEVTTPGTAVHSFGDALWWALTTVTTVGYGDISPISSQGRIVAALLMLTGIAVAGVVTAMVSAWLVEQVQNDAVREGEISEAQRHDELMETLQVMNSEIQRLSAELAQLRRGKDEP
ncbi:potassium channel family protein [Corynebacterium sp. ES2794-CONJ1]|uniref:potassium channel family protein n=1 Tax=unclassified Corynebacterium TaxID=2624378 RepID=UPI00216AE2EB|nr:MULTISPECIES: potassium channel family protein [unclassified Corynebacterium]MCS4530981.1 potassium channel family protein [Corynebacterium sp. ES2730-CONJ]MCU9518348.1 potassium channel family protein [Corynebacterium sp. ES2794-CONJ1]